MFNWLFSRNKRRHNDDAVEFIERVLFPPVEIHEEDGTEFFVDYAVDTNLEALYNDLKDGISDENSMRTLRYCIEALREVRKRYKLFSTLRRLKNKQSSTFYMVSANRNK